MRILIRPGAHERAHIIVLQDGECCVVQMFACFSRCPTHSLTPPAVKPPTRYFSNQKKSTIIGTVTITAPAIKNCLGTSWELRATMPLDRVKIVGLSKNINANKN